VIFQTDSKLDAIRIQLRDVFEIYFSALDQIKDIEPCSRAPRKVTVAL
jgi:hypothetical protein